MNSKVELLEQGQGYMFLAEGNPGPSRKQNQEDSLQFNASNYQSSNVIQPTSPIHIENFLELKDGNNYNLIFRRNDMSTIFSQYFYNKS